ncbi:hypothetical protein [Absidia glauca]|uniref:Ricin B lectin domain-containing protein n=1 Tax=Absidia glauca TaxID=4829 RepID=A0A168SD32_ABSGL|nr:hypothetical protein [Absidia glauca]
MFPEGLFYILSRKNGFALDVYDGQTKEDANIIVWPQKFEDSDNQLWSYDNGRLINKKSGHALDIRSSAFKKDKAIVQNKRKDKNQSQFWLFDQGFICSQEYPSMVFDIKGDSDKGGAHVVLYKRKDSDNLNQQWYLESYHNFESALNMATTSVSLHKKEGFGQPRLGYGAEIGIPPELKELPADTQIAGLSTIASKPLPHPTDSNSPRPGPASDYQASSSQHAHDSYPSSSPPPSQIYPPQHSASPPQGYPPPPSQGYPPPPPPQQQHQQQHYQQESGYPPPQSMPSPGASGPGVGGFYVPPASNQPSYPYPSYPSQ